MSPGEPGRALIPDHLGPPATAGCPVRSPIPLGRPPPASIRKKVALASRRRARRITPVSVRVGISRADWRSASQVPLVPLKGPSWVAKVPSGEAFGARAALASARGRIVAQRPLDQVSTGQRATEGRHAVLLIAVQRAGHRVAVEVDGALCRLLGGTRRRPRDEIQDRRAGPAGVGRRELKRVLVPEGSLHLRQEGGDLEIPGAREVHRMGGRRSGGEERSGDEGETDCERSHGLPLQRPTGEQIPCGYSAHWSPLPDEPGRRPKSAGTDRAGARRAGRPGAGPRRHPTARPARRARPPGSGGGGSRRWRPGRC